jgi:acyl-CoA synthetase (AMP-forming)/AMP-acid ligase II
LTERLDVRPGDHVCILDKNSDSYLELLFAISKAGAIATPVNWRVTVDEASAVVRDAEARYVFVGDEFASRVRSADAKIIGLDEAPRVQGANDPHLDAERDVCWQLYTSGTTGQPKGAMLTSKNLIGNLGLPFGLEFPEFQATGRALVSMPLYHMGGCGWALAAMIAGETAVVLREFDAAEVLSILSSQPIDTAFLVPAALLLLTERPESQTATYSALKSIAYGASPITQDVLQRSMQTFGCQFRQLYGLTETTGAICFLRHEDHVEGRMFSCGRPGFGAEMKVVDADGDEVPRGDIGEVVYRGVATMKGYWKRPIETAATVRGGWLHTGDAGLEDEEGLYYLKDRMNDLIISGGENVYPAEVESVLAQHPAVRDVAVIGVPDQRWGEAVKAIVVLEPGAELPMSEFISWSQDKLAGYKRPQSAEVVDELPRNPSGKILKRQLRSVYWEGQDRQIH